MTNDENGEQVRAKKWCRKYQRGGRCPECEQISRILAAKSLTIEALAQTLKASPAKIHYHLASLAKREVVEKRGGSYVVAAPKKLDKLILRDVARGLTNVNLLKSDPELQDHPPEAILQSIGKMELRRLIRTIQPIDLSKPSAELPTDYVITYVGAMELGVCPRCGKEVSHDGLYVQILISEIITKVPEEEEPLESPFTNEKGVLFHSACFRDEMKDELSNRDGGSTVRADELCGVCGLPLDPRTLETMIHDHAGPNDIVRELTVEEWRGLAARTSVKRRELSEEAYRGLAHVALMKMTEKNPHAFHGLGDIELVIQKANEGLKAVGENTLNHSEVVARAKEVWNSVKETVNRRHDQKLRNVTEICGAPSVVLADQELHWWTSAIGGGGPFSEEPPNPSDENGNTEGVVAGSTSGILVKKGAKSMHPWCYRFLGKHDPNQTTPPDADSTKVEPKR